MCFDVSMPTRLICSTDGLLCLRSTTTSFWHIDAVGGRPPQQIGERPYNPIITPGPILLGHANNQFLDFAVDPWPARGSTCPRSIELASDEPSVPCQDGVWQGGRRHG